MQINIRKKRGRYMKNKKASSENYLDKCPVMAENVKWFSDSEDGNLITLCVENKGVFNKIAQLLFSKPKVTKTHLEEMGSFIWPLIDGRKTVGQIGDKVKEHFGEKAEPVYERIAKYFVMLESYKFIFFK